VEKVPGSTPGFSIASAASHPELLNLLLLLQARVLFFVGGVFFSYKAVDQLLFRVRVSPLQHISMPVSLLFHLFVHLDHSLCCQMTDSPRRSTWS
jgi:hypothetical protein